MITIHRSGYWSFLITLLFLLCAFLESAEAGGLSTDFAEVVLENLQIGKKYSIREVADLPMEVTNTSDYTVELKIDILIPQDEELKPNYEAIPESSWIELEQNLFVVEPKQSIVTDVVISIPDDDKYLGKSFQVYIWSHTIGSGIEVGLKSRLLFSIKAQKE